MRLKCDDNKIRRLRVAHYDGERGISGTWNAKCEECGKDFGCHDTKIIKPQFKKHICWRKEE